MIFSSKHACIEFYQVQQTNPHIQHLDFQIFTQHLGFCIKINDQCKAEFFKCFKNLQLRMNLVSLQ